MTENDKSTEEMIQAAGLTAPRLSPAIVQANIAHTEIVKHITNGGQVLRWAIITTLSGFGVVGRPSVSVSPENDNEEIGIKVATENSTAEMWPLMGYELKQRLFEASNAPPAPHSDKPAHQQRVIIERDELAAKITKLQAFLVTPTYARLTDEEQGRLADQVAAMRSYCGILNARIEAFPAA